MISILKIKEIDKDRITKLNSTNGHIDENEFAENIDNMMVIYDRDSILGYSQYSLLDNNESKYHEKYIGNLKILFILPQERRSKLGDGLYRATLNQMLTDGIKLVKVDDKLKKIDDVVKFLSWEDINIEGLQSIEELFSRKCRG